MRSLALPLITALAVFMLGDALGDKDWLLAFPLAVIAISALVLLAFDATPAAPAVPDPAATTGDSVAATGGGQ